jgi:hypothetical protein
MNESYFVRATKVNARVAELIIEGQHININGYKFEKLSKKPRGRTIERKLQNVESQERFIIYS